MPCKAAYSQVPALELDVFEATVAQPNTGSLSRCILTHIQKRVSTVTQKELPLHWRDRSMGPTFHIYPSPFSFQPPT